MLVVISDLHFQEVASDAIPGEDGGLRFDRNFPPAAFERFFAYLVGEAVRNGATRVDLVLAGDVFDLHRTQLWFSEDGDAGLRPYESAADVEPGSPLEQKILQILDAIASEERVGGSLAAIRRLAEGKYLAEPGDPGSERPFPLPVSLTYLPGNHDRLADGGAAVRTKVRELLGLPGGGERFPHLFAPEGGDPRAIVRHGHEYDPLNFGKDLHKSDPFPEEIPDAVYDEATIGDYLTVDVASRLPTIFRKVHGDESILASPLLSRLYLRLLEFDDLRPQSLLLDFLTHVPGVGVEEDRVWDAVEPVLFALLSQVRESDYFRGWLDELGVRWHPLLSDAAKLFLDSGVWKLGISLTAMRYATRHLATEGAGNSPEVCAAREKGVKEGRLRFVVAGHTHTPKVALIGARGSLAQYYVDTGTWRNRVLAGPGRVSFGTLKSITSVVVYSSVEDPGHSSTLEDKNESFDFWSGFTQRWPAPPA